MKVNSKLKVYIDNEKIVISHNGSLSYIDHSEWEQQNKKKKVHLFLSPYFYNTIIEDKKSVSSLNENELFYYIKSKYLKKSITFTYRIYRASKKLFIFYIQDEKMAILNSIFGEKNILSLKPAIFLMLQPLFKKEFTAKPLLFALEEDDFTSFLAVKKEPLFFRKKPSLSLDEKVKEFLTTISFLKKSENFEPQVVLSSFYTGFENEIQIDSNKLKEELLK